VILRLAVLIQYRSVKDTHIHTHRRTDTRRRHIPRCRAVKTIVKPLSVDYVAKIQLYIVYKFGELWSSNPRDYEGKIKFFNTRYEALGPDLILVYRQSARG